jgi:shikimate dehydrogenase
VKGLRFAVVGDPVAHSKSPAMHAAAYRALGMPHAYEAIRATAEELPRIVERLRAGDLAGVNVTVPHKQRVLGLADDVDASARAVGAANTLVRTPDGRVVAHNTDVPALEQELRALGAREGGGAIVLGAGGAARAAAFALRRLGASPIVVRARDEVARDAMIASMRAALSLDERALRGEPLAPSRADAAAIVVQATSAGMHGASAGDVVADAIDWSALPEDAVALDVVYAPPDTPFLRCARARALRTANGFGMLARQGALAFELWLGVAPPLDVMLRALVAE